MPQFSKFVDNSQKPTLSAALILRCKLKRRLEPLADGERLKLAWSIDSSFRLRNANAGTSLAAQTASKRPSVLAGQATAQQYAQILFHFSAPPLVLREFTRYRGGVRRRAS